MDLCTVCTGPNARLCSQCKGSRYCSPTCQRNDWRSHKLLCAAFSSFETSTRPSDEHFRAIFFPVDEEKPKLVWVHCPWGLLERYQSPDLDPFFGTDVSLDRVSVHTNPLLKRKLSDTFKICHRDAFLTDGSITNKSVASITARRPGQCYDWRGPIIVYGMVGTNVDPIACKSLDMTDFRHIVDYLLWYNCKPLSASQYTLSETVMGVRINCVGDREMSHKPLFEAVQVPLTDPVFLRHDTSDIAERIGLPILTRRFPHNPRWVREQCSQIPTNNQDAALLHLCCHPEVGSLDSGK